MVYICSVKLHMWQNVWNLYCVAHKMWCNSFLPCFYYPCCDDMDINQLETYGY